MGVSGALGFGVLGLGFWVLCFWVWWLLGLGFLRFLGFGVLGLLGLACFLFGFGWLWGLLGLFGYSSSFWRFGVSGFGVSGFEVLGFWGLGFKVLGFLVVRFKSLGIEESFRASLNEITGNSREGVMVPLGCWFLHGCTAV